MLSVLFRPGTSLCGRFGTRSCVTEYWSALDTLAAGSVDVKSLTGNLKLEHVRFPDIATFPITRYTSTDLLCSIMPGEIMALTIGTKLGRYEIRSRLGAGGMGEVYLAQDTRPVLRCPGWHLRKSCDHGLVYSANSDSFWRARVYFPTAVTLEDL